MIWKLAIVLKNSEFQGFQTWAWFGLDLWGWTWALDGLKCKTNQGQGFDQL